MKKNFKLTLICFSMCSLFAFTGLKAQDVITEEFYVDEIRESPIRFHDFSDFYVSFLTMEANNEIGKDLGADMPKHGIGLGWRTVVPLGTDYFTMNCNFGYSFGFRTYTKNFADLSSQRTLTHSAFVDLGFGGQVFFTRNHRNGMGIFAGFGYDYGELHLSKAAKGHAMVLDSKVMQHAFYVPVGVKFFFGKVSLSATYRFRAFDIDMTVESCNSENSTAIKEGRTLNMFPLEIGLGFNF